MTEAVTITGLNRVAEVKPNKGGSTVLAWFDCEARGITFTGCALARTPKNGLVAWPPKLDGKEGLRRSVRINDDSLRHAMMLHAREAYRALGGTDAEWVGRIVPNGPIEDDAEPERRGDPLIVRRRVEEGFAPKYKGDVGYDGYPLERDLTDDEAQAGLNAYLGNADG